MVLGKPDKNYIRLQIDLLFSYVLVCFCTKYMEGFSPGNFSFYGFSYVTVIALLSRTELQSTKSSNVSCMKLGWARLLVDLKDSSFIQGKISRKK